MDSKPESKEYVPVYETSGKLAAESIRLMLEAKGIPAFVSQESAGVTFGLTIGLLGTAKVYVAASQEEDARQILRDMEAGKLENVDLLTNEDPGDEDDSN